YIADRSPPSFATEPLREFLKAPPTHPPGLITSANFTTRHVSNSRAAAHFPYRRSTVMERIYALVAAAFLTLVFCVSTAFSQGNATRGQRIFGACAACHSLQPDQNMTGPSLAGLWDRKAGTLASFKRYSAALQSSNIVWNDKTLDDWITDSQHV